MDKKPAYHTRGRTGKEGLLLKTIGVLAAAIGLVWVLLVLSFSESGTAWILPVCTMVVGGLVFWSGRSVARAAAA